MKKSKLSNMAMVELNIMEVVKVLLDAVPAEHVKRIKDAERGLSTKLILKDMELVLAEIQISQMWLWWMDRLPIDLMVKKKCHIDNSRMISMKFGDVDTSQLMTTTKNLVDHLT